MLAVFPLGAFTLWDYLQFLQNSEPSLRLKKKKKGKVSLAVVGSVWFGFYFLCGLEG